MQIPVNRPTACLTASSCPGYFTDDVIKLNLEVDGVNKHSGTSTL
jgi:hypothetical protein